MRQAAILVSLALLTFACDNNEPDQSPIEQPAMSESWAPPDAYTYELRSSCGERALIGHFRIRVADGQVQSVAPLDSSARALIRSGFRDEVPTLEALISEAAEAERNGADLVEIRRDEGGQPNRLEIDYNKNAVDDEACYVIRHFEPFNS